MPGVTASSFDAAASVGDLRRLIIELAGMGVQLDPSAYEHLRQTDPAKLVALREALFHGAREDPGLKRLLTREDLIELFKFHESPERGIMSSVVTTTLPAKDIQPQVEVLKDPARDLSKGSRIEDFSSYFRDRFNRLTSILLDRQDVKGSVSVAEALRLPQNAKVKVIVMVLEKRERHGNFFLEAEDLSDSCSILVPAQSSSAHDAAGKLPRDQVICVEGVRGKGDLLIAREILLPDIASRKPRLAKEDVWAVLLSDFHAGSSRFLGESLRRAMDWLNMKVGTPEQRAIAARVKYVVICGDLVDGVGVYPQQERELAITDLHEQYEEAARYVGDIPDYMEVVVLPGNHDPVRQALPQPPLPKDFAEPVYESRRLISVGNPAEVSFHDVRFLLHHGRSLDDVIASVQGMSFAQPEKAMIFQLQCRHLASEYGSRTAIAPEVRDSLVIDDVPDVFQSGHIHVVKYENYRGTQVINSGAWQAQTDYQRKYGLVPTPGILTAINLHTLEVRLLSFI